MYPKIYLGQTPDTPQARRVLRERALALHTRFQPAPEPVYALLHFAADAASAPLDVLLLRPESTLVGNIIDTGGPVDITPNGQWIVRESGAQLRGSQGQTPLQAVRQGQTLVRQQLTRFFQNASPPITFERLVGALVFAPTSHPESHIALDVDNHRRQIKIVGLDELAALTSMIYTNPYLAEPQLRAVVAELFGGREWHNGEQLLFEIGLTGWQLRVLAGASQPEQVLPLAEGATIIGRRRQPLKHEYRLTLPGDDLMSNDHALLACLPDGRVIVRDTSTNGTWVTAPGGSEERIARAERTLAAGSTLRMGVTRMVLERL